MKTIIERPVLAVIFFIIVVILGIYSFNNTPIELVPKEDLPSLSISYQWWGASPDKILQKVLVPAEAEIVQLKGITKIQSRAYQNRGEITVEFARDTRMDFANVLLSERLNKLQKDMPLQVQKPLIVSREPDDFKTRPFMTIGITGKFSIYNLKRIAEKEILPYLKSISGIESVQLIGGVDPEIKINTNMDKLKLYGISLYEIYSKFRDNFYTIQSVSMTKDRTELSLSLTRNPRTIQNIENIIIKKTGKKNILLKELASVELGYQDIVSEMRFMGKTVIGFTLTKERNESSIPLARRVRERLQKLANRLNGKIDFIIQEDESRELKENIDKLVKIAFLVLIIIFIILIVIVKDVKATLLIFSSVFFSVFTTFTVIYIFKIPLNILTLSGLALGFGLFVDNAVVVFDSILRFMERGYEKKEAAVEGAKAVFLPVISSTFTTIIVFFSFTYFQGRLRVYYLPLSYIITISLLSSIIVSFVLIPSLSARLSLKVRSRSREIKKGKLFPFIIKYPLVVIISVTLIFIFSFNHFKDEVSFGAFWSWYRQEAINVRLFFPSSAEFDDVKEGILKFEEIILKKDYKKEVTTRISAGNYKYANLSVTFPKDVELSAAPYQLKQELAGLASNFAGVGVYVTGFDNENYMYNPNTGTFLSHSIEIRGYNFEKLMDYTNNLKKSLLNHRRIKDVDIDTDIAKSWRTTKEKYFSLKPDLNKLSKLKISSGYLSSLLSTFLRERASMNKVKFDDKEIFIEIKTEGVKDLELSDIVNYNFKTPDGIPFRIGDLVSITMTEQKGGIGRENQEYIARVMWDYRGSDKAATRFRDTLYKNLVVPVGFKKVEEEETDLMTEQEETQLWQAIVISGFLIYLILGILYENFFQPLLIMLSIPLALIGVFWGFIIMDYNFDSSAYIGVILLSGIVVNNAIILIDNINLSLKSASTVREAIIRGTKERIRPVFMTSATTVLGMLPMILLQKSGETDIWSALALCTIGGLTSSAILILFVMPVFYDLFYRLQKALFKAEKS